MATESVANLELRLKSTPIAVVGMSAVLPGAHNLPEYWDNILKKIDCITDVPPSRWNIDDYYDPDPTAPDKTYCKRGGFIPDVDFDPLEFGLPPNILEVTDVSQLLGLVVARDALDDAGLGEGRDWNRDRAGVILGVVGMSTKLFTPLMARLQYPVWRKVLRSAGITEPDTEKIIEKIKLAYVGWEENAFPGTIVNVIAGRIANRFDLGGTNLVVDAACGSSLAAIKLACSELIEGRADVMISGGVDTDNSINTYLCFSKTPAFSKSDRVRTFDTESDGMMVGEGLAMVVLKRLADAERDGDRIYAVVKGIGSSSDGRFKSIYAPRAAGQVKALKRAYEEAGFAPHTLGLVEAHGTGTMAGDPEEVRSLREVVAESSAAAGNGSNGRIALGSVKSQIAHTKATAGAAGFVKAVLALHHKVLPATINVNKPSPKLELDGTPVYINTETRPWIRRADGTPRRAGVSSFGFGGTNYHIVLEEYTREHTAPYRLNLAARAILFHAESPAALAANCRAALAALNSPDAASKFLNLLEASRTLAIPPDHARLGLLAAAPAEAARLLADAAAALDENPAAGAWEKPAGLFYRRRALNVDGSVVALFPGQGSQYVDMGRELAVSFPAVRETFAEMDALFAADNLAPLSEVVFPVPAFDSEEKDAQSARLTRTEHAQPAIGALSLAMLRVLKHAGFQPDFTAGHSFGELTALCAAGALSETDALALMKARGKAMAPPAQNNGSTPSDFDPGTMLAVKGDAEKVKTAIAGFPQVRLANYNSPDQVVLAGPKAEIARVKDVLSGQGFSVIPLTVSAAFHTPLVGHAQKPFAASIQSTPFHPAGARVFSNTSAQAYPSDPAAMQAVLSDHMLNSVLWKDEIEAIYAAGGRVFVEIGPKSVLTSLVGGILAGKEHLAIALNSNPKKDGDRQFREAVLALRVAGLTLSEIDAYTLPARTVIRKKSPVTIQLNGGLYMSDKTKKAFEDALTDGWKVQSTQPEHNPIPAPAPAAQQAAQSWDVPPPAADFAAANDSALDQYLTLQSEDVRLHEQYLRTEEEYARAFAEMTHLQTELVRQAAAGANPSVAALFESLERSMVRFHDHQAETLRVHQRYLDARLGSPAAAAPAPRVSAAPYPTAAAPSQLSPAIPGTRQPEHQPAQAAAPAPVVSSAPMTAQPAPVEAAVPAAVLTAVPAPADAPDLLSALLDVVSEKTGYPVDTLEPGMDMESDLGIDSIKRVEILGAMQERFPHLPKPDAAELAELRTLAQVCDYLGQSQPAPSASQTAATPDAAGELAASPSAQRVEAVSQSGASLQAALLEIVSEKTGYPVETLEVDMDMEADLGIDSIKRVEILGAMETRFPHLPKPDAAALAELRTLAQVLEFMSGSSPAQPTDNQPVESAVKPADSESTVSIPRNVVSIRSLPAPDALAFHLPEGSSCLLVADGSPVTARLAAALLEKGWPVGVLEFPEGTAPAQEGLPPAAARFRLSAMSEDNLNSCLAQVRAQLGPVAVFIHLEARSPLNGDVTFPENHKAVLKQVFLLAKLLKEDLNAAAAVQGARGAFLTISRLDGEFGLGSEGMYTPVDGGLFGLVKTLNLEWEQVYCRAVDLSPALDSETATGYILAELHDPNRLITEVAYNLFGRSTLVAETDGVHS